MLSGSLVLISLVTMMSANLIPIPEERIVGGDKENITNVPWQVAVLIDGAPRCGGVVYKKNIILTAAHCLGVGENYAVRVGSSSKSCGGLIVKVAESKFHNKSDIGMLILSSPLKFNDFTNPIELANESPEAGTPAFVSGWESTSFSPGFPSPDHLQVTNVTIKDRYRCQKALKALKVLLAEDPSEATLEKDEICASLNGEGSCHGDSGGPLVSFESRKLIGIVSHGFRCLSPGIYVDIASVKKWIEDTAAEYGYQTEQLAS